MDNYPMNECSRSISLSLSISCVLDAQDMEAWDGYEYEVSKCPCCEWSDLIVHE